ncbi:MAG TPA: zinc ribbon domain-containing protein [Pyrinomonadaceae bacterium]|nr:zinc ribbon domain-containing protein [Pyrinomonadaceae bacterium]
MFCPRCGQQQLSESVRFCSRCGFALRAVTELLDGDGALAERTGKGLESRLSPRQKGARLGALLMLTSFLIALIQAFMPTLVDKLVVLAAPVVICFLVGFVRLLYALFFEEGAASRKGAALGEGEAPALKGAAGAALPPAQSIPVSGWRRRANTAEMARPLSVTEGTTELLESDSGALSG